MEGMERSWTTFVGVWNVMKTFTMDPYGVWWTKVLVCMFEDEFSYIILSVGVIHVIIKQEKHPSLYDTSY